MAANQGIQPNSAKTSPNITTHHVQAAVPRQAGSGCPGVANNVGEGASAAELGDDAGWLRANAHELDDVGVAQGRQQARLLRTHIHSQGCTSEKEKRLQRSYS